MARPNSKYFTPVIRKLLEARRGEKIIVDEPFKARLRAGLIAKAGGASLPERRMAGTERQTIPSGREVLDWNKVSDFFLKWRYQIALVPSALLLVLVAVQASKLPVFMKSQVVVPTGETQAATGATQVVKTDTGQIPAEKQPAVTADAATASPESQQKLKTFAGRTVLPSSYFNKTAPQISATQLAAPVSGSETIPNELPPATFETSAATPEKISVSPAQPQAVREVVVVPAATAPQPQITSQTWADTSVESLPYEKEKPQGIEAGDVPGSEVTVQQEQETGYVPGEAVQPTVEPVQNVQNLTQQTVPQQTVEQRAQPYSYKSEPAAAPMEIIVKPADQETGVKITLPAVMRAVPLYPIYYYFDFADEEKKFFEETVVVPLTEGKDVSYVTVMLNEDQLTVVDVYLQDGSRETEYFQKNANGTWDHVEYVTRYYYDNGLQYELAPTYMPFQDSGGYHYEY